MKILFEFFPILIFFLSFKLFGIYTATFIAIIASIVQVGYFRFKHGYLESMHILTVCVIVLLGGATLFFHNDLFIKWKPTALYWALAAFYFGYEWVTKTPLIQKLMGKEITLPLCIWQRLSLTWIFFFIAMGIANLIVAYHFDTDTWVNFKLFGVLGMTVIFVIGQAVYLSKHIEHKQVPN